MDKMLSCCGVDCFECPYYPADCRGCAAIKGEVFWLEYTKESICGIYDCCVNSRKLEHCGNCEKLPCDRFYALDPTKTMEENEKDFMRQLTQLHSMKTNISFYG